MAVKYAGSQCAPNAFVQLLKERFEAPGDQRCAGVTIQLNADDYSVRYLAGVRNEFERKLAVELPDAVPPLVNVGGDLLTGNSAGRDQIITAHFGDTFAEPLMRRSRDRWVTALCDELKNFLAHNKFMIFLYPSDVLAQQEFWKVIWARISGLVEAGLVLVKLIDTEKPGADDIADACQHDCEIVLPKEFGDQQARHAVEDVSQILRELDFQEAECTPLAKAYVQLNRNSVRGLRDGLLSFTKGVRGLEQ